MTARLKNDGDVVIFRSNDDSANTPIEVSGIKITDAPDADKILTSDVDGNGTWQTNAAIELANNAQTAAETAQTTADNAASAAATAQGTADAALADAATATAAAAAAMAEATAATAAALVANGLAVAAGIDAATAQTRADDAYTLAGVALDAAQRAYPESVRCFGDEFNIIVGTPSFTLNTGVPYNWTVSTSVNNADWRLGLNLRAGTWTFKLMTIINSGGARASISVGSHVLADPEEMYSAVQNLQKIFTYPSVTISGSDRYEVRFLVNGHHASSSGYGFAVTKFWGYRTGA
jgi:hypothetical protein